MISSWNMKESCSFSQPQSRAKPLLSLASLCLVQRQSPISHKWTLQHYWKHALKTLARYRYLNDSINIALRQFFQYAVNQKEYFFAHNFMDFFFFSHMEFEEGGKTSATCKRFGKCVLVAAFHTVEVLLLQGQPCKRLSTHVPRLIFFLSFFFSLSFLRPAC